MNKLQNWMKMCYFLHKSVDTNTVSKEALTEPETKSAYQTYSKINSRSVETQTDLEVIPVKDNKQELVNIKCDLLRAQEVLKRKNTLLIS
ncbi:unnamed protein product [Acanthoscelides obtectus]|uniref:Uncharacterized protein n=1 Tax=Acanthoscelides obtectus TaxID=200917 RepID=A0A9P0QFE9_ACAOB|nr:unnamed protein product [Acanthoscelides obtectus]CAK1682670.1 hypothetical protein AOBTE_LOCUS33777 [Acanthoscelides obtectus]